jgi:hypothetical protein
MSSADLPDAHEYRLEPQPGPDVQGFCSGGDGQGEMRVRANAAQRGIVTSNPSAGGGGDGFYLLGF